MTENTPKMKFRSQGFSVLYGNSLIVTITDSLGDYVLVAHPEPWKLVKSTLNNLPVEVIQAGDLSSSHLDSIVARIGRPSAIIGLGGGTAMDTAKWIHWRSGIPLYQVPSLPSVNACFTRMTALRDRGGVRYQGDAVPECVLVDYELIKSAPRDLISGGIGDVLSCHTARWDWKISGDRDYPWDEEQAAMSLVYIDELEELSPFLARGDDDGVRRLMECHRDIGWRCHELGHARFEEGSEHFFAYTFEAVTGRTIMHGELVALGALIMSAIQGNDPARVRRITDLAQMRTSLDSLGVSWSEVEQSLKRLPSFVEEQKLWFSVANGLDINEAQLEIARVAIRA